MIRRGLTLLAAAVALVAVPAVAAASSIASFSASATVARTAPGITAIDSSTGGLLTTGQVFTGTLGSTWNGLDGATIAVNQNSLIGIDPIALGTTGTSPLSGQAWGTFAISQGAGSVSGAYTAEIDGTLYLDPFGTVFGCPATSVLGPIDITGDGVPDPVGAFVSVADAGAWQVAPDSATGRMKRIDHIGGMLLAVAGGCLEGNEVAELTLIGQLAPPGQNGRGDDDRDSGDGHGRGNRGDRDRDANDRDSRGAQAANDNDRDGQDDDDDDGNDRNRGSRGDDGRGARGRR